MITKSQWAKRADELAGIVDELRPENERLREEAGRLKSDMESMSGEIKFLRSHLKETLIHIQKERIEGNIVKDGWWGESYAPRFSKTQIDTMWHEMGFWKGEEE